MAGFYGQFTQALGGRQGHRERAHELPVVLDNPAPSTACALAGRRDILVNGGVVQPHFPQLRVRGVKQLGQPVGVVILEQTGREGRSHGPIQPETSAAGSRGLDAPNDLLKN